MNLIQLQADLSSVKTRAKNLLERTMEDCKRDARAMTPTEAASIQDIVSEGKALKARIDKAQGDASMTAAIENLTGDMMRGTSPGGGRTRSIGQQIVSDPRFADFIRAGGHRASGQWSSPVIEMSATTLSEDSGSAGALVIPDTQRRIIEVPTRPLTMLDLIAPGTTDSNAVQ